MLAALKGAYHKAISPITLDLSKVATLSARHKGLRVVKRVLSSINTSVSPVSDLGFFTRSDTDFERALDLMQQGRDLVSRTTLPVGLQEIEIGNSNSITNASGRLAYAYFRSADYPWLVDQTGHLGLDTQAPLALGHIFEVIRKQAGFSDVDVIRRNVDHFGSDGPPCYYKKGSSYGLCPYVPGKSKMNTLALLYHNIVAGALSQEISRLGNPSLEKVSALFDDIQSDYMTGEAAHPYGGKIMMISRARPMSVAKPIPHWRVDYQNKRLVASSEEAGFRAGTREIKAVPAFINLLFSPFAGMFSEVCRHVPGLHVGHQVLSASFMRRCFDNWGPTTSLHIEDISGYDNSVNSNHLSAFRTFMRRGFLMNDHTDAYLQAIDNVDIVTGRLFDTDADTVTLLRRRDGIASGFQGTTMYGTLINLITIIDAMAQVRGVSCDEVVRRCANFQNVINPSDHFLRSSDWGFLLKGDDLILFSRPGVTSWNDFAACRLAQGIKTDVEPGPIFLMQYIDVNRSLTGRDFPFCPESMLNIKTFKSFGLILKRLGNRLIFNEHPITDERVARLAITANLEDTVLHPLYDFLEMALISSLNRYDSIKWRDAKHLRTYVTSEKGRKDMMDYASKAGSSDPFLRELVRRKDFFEGLGEDSDGTISSESNALPVWAVEILDSIGDISLPALTTSFDLKDKDINASIEDLASSSVIINPTRKGGRSTVYDSLSVSTKQYAKKIFTILTEKTA